MSGIDWKKLRDEATTILEGDFAIVITKAEVGESAAKKPRIACTLVIESGPFQGRKVYHSFYISPESQPAMNMFFRAMTVLGLGDAFFAQQPSMEGIAEALMGKRATVTITKRQWNGEDRENIQTWSEATGTGAPVMGVPIIASTPSLSGITAGALPSTPAPDLGPDPF